MVRGSPITKKVMFEENHDLYVIYQEHIIHQKLGLSRIEMSYYDDYEFEILYLYAGEIAKKEKEISDKAKADANKNKPKGRRR